MWSNMRVDKHFRLDHIDTRDTHGLKKEEGEERLKVAQMAIRMEQKKLFANANVARRNADYSLMLRVLAAVNGMDTSGKNVSMRETFKEVDPVGFRAYSFGKPTEKELAKGFLWRHEIAVPGIGEIAGWVRSHYENVVAVRVRKLAPPDVWKPRYGLINDFERREKAEGTLWLKFFLHISMEEQRKRQQARVVEQTKQFKFNPEDIETRKHWDEYMEAWEDAINECCEIPWYVIPSDKPWFRNLVMTEITAHETKRLGLEWPKPTFDTNMTIT